jgi:peroxiredoxin
MISINRKSWYILSVFILAIGALWIRFTAIHFGRGTNGKTPAPHKGFLAPDFAALSLSEENYHSLYLKGKPVAMNYGQAGACPAENTRLGENLPGIPGQGLIILAVNATNQDQLEKVNAFVKEYQLTFSLLDENGAITDAYQISAFPPPFSSLRMEPSRMLS